MADPAAREGLSEQSQGAPGTPMRGTPPQGFGSPPDRVRQTEPRHPAHRLHRHRGAAGAQRRTAAAQCPKPDVPGDAPGTARSTLSVNASAGTTVERAKLVPSLAELAQQAHVVADRVVFDRAAALVEAVHVALAPLDLPAGGPDPEEGALVGPRHRADADHRVAVAGQVLDLEVRVWKGLPEPFDHLTVPLRSARRSRQRVVVHEIGRRDRVEHIKLARVERLTPERSYAPFDRAFHVVPSRDDDTDLAAAAVGHSQVVPPFARGLCELMDELEGVGPDPREGTLVESGVVAPPAQHAVVERDAV